MIHPELEKGEIFLGYIEKFLVDNLTNFKTKRAGLIVINPKGKAPAIDEDGNVFRQGEDFPYFVDIKELEDGGMDMEWFFELNPMIAALNGQKKGEEKWLISLKKLNRL